MNYLRRLKMLWACLAVSLALFPNSADAYLDPGTGSFMMQILVGAVLGGMVAVGVFWRKLTAFLRRLFTGGAKDDKPEPK